MVHSISQFGSILLSFPLHSNCQLPVMGRAVGAMTENVFAEFVWPLHWCFGFSENFVQMEHLMAVVVCLLTQGHMFAGILNHAHQVQHQCLP